MRSDPLVYTESRIDSVKNTCQKSFILHGWKGGTDAVGPNLNKKKEVGADSDDIRRAGRTSRRWTQSSSRWLRFRRPRRMVTLTKYLAVWGAHGPASNTRSSRHPHPQKYKNIEERGDGLHKCTTTKKRGGRVACSKKRPTPPTVNRSWLPAIVGVFLWSGPREHSGSALSSTRHTDSASVSRRKEPRISSDSCDYGINGDCIWMICWLFQIIIRCSGSSSKAVGDIGNGGARPPTPCRCRLEPSRDRMARRGPQGVTDNERAKKSVPSPPPPSRGPSAAHTLDFGVEAVVGLVGLGARELEVVFLVRPDLAPLRVVPV